MQARPNGIWPIPAGFSRLSYWSGSSRDYRPFHPAYRVLFNSYYNAIGDKHPRPERGLISRPGLPEIHAYRRHVDACMAELLGNSVGDNPEFSELVELGVNHEEQHQELILTDLKHLLWKNSLRPAYVERWPLTPIRGRKSHWVGFEGGLNQIGHEGEGFAFDNECPRHAVVLRAIRNRDPPGHSRRLSRVYRGRRLRARRALAVVGLGFRSERRAGVRRNIGNGRGTTGARSLFTEW